MSLILDIVMVSSGLLLLLLCSCVTMMIISNVYWLFLSEFVIHFPL